MASASRPFSTATARMLSRYSFIRSAVEARASTTSEFLPAKSRPRPDAPAWTITGSSAAGAVFSGPRTRKNRPSWSMVCTLRKSANTPFAASSTIASGSQLRQSLRTTSTHSSARS